MFAALSSFVPNILILGDKDKPEPPIGPDEDDAEENEPDPALAISHAPGVKPTGDPSPIALPENTAENKPIPRQRRAKQETPLWEMYIIVRPPPAKNNHPLNLQIQLVPPRPTPARSATRHSGDFSPGEPTAPIDSAVSSTPDEATLGPTGSGSSDRSFGFYASSSSVGSVGSLASTSTTGTARRIVPLYNLSAHNVMTNTVTDAGTDAKIAKFQKRCLDIIRLGTWEPVEVWSHQTDEFGRLSRPGAMPSGGQELRTELFVRSTPNAPQNDHRRSFLEPIPRPPPAAVPTLDPPRSPQSSSKKFFGKVFKTKRDPTTPSFSSLNPSNSLQALSFGRASKRQSYQLPDSTVSLSLSVSNQSSLHSQASANPVVPSVQRSSGEPVLQPPILGLQAAVHASLHEIPTGRPTTHLWILRKWAKEKQLIPEGILRGLASGLSARSGASASNGGSNAQVGSTPSVEIRFEWTRGMSSSKKKGHKAAGGARRPSTRDGVRRRALTEEESDDVTVSSGHSKTSPPVSPGPSAHLTLPTHPSIRRRNSVGPASEHTHTSQPAATDSHEDAGEDSDIEDSETPWTCTLHMYPSNLSPLSERDAKERAAVPGSSRDGRLRLRLATIVPTPHHPKILVQFRMPFPLPDIAITPDAATSGWTQPHYDFGVGARFLPRTLSADGTIQRSTPGSMMGTEIPFTAEDIKDVVASTGFWLVVREGFGGLGKIKRKGDGWHIRA